MSLLQRLCLLKTDWMKANAIAGLHLADFPQFRFGDGDRTDKAAEAWAIAGEDHRKIAGEVHRTNGVFAIMHVGRVQARFAAVGARPLRFRPDQPHTKAIGVVVHLPFAGKKSIDRGFGKEIRRTVRPIKYAD